MLTVNASNPPPFPSTTTSTTTSGVKLHNEIHLKGCDVSSLKAAESQAGENWSQISLPL